MKRKRQEKIIKLIQSTDIETQEGILEGLREAGLEVTQATVSRDIKELHLVKTLSPSGRYRYAVTRQTGGQDNSGKYHSILSEALISAEAAVNMVVVKCHVGMAQAACACLDQTERAGVVGTLAGDDTIFVVMKTEEAAETFVRELERYIQH